MSHNKTYTFFTDPGHSWLRVLRIDIQPIKDDISNYSYQKGKYVYLEEDCDANTFLKFKFGEDMSFGELVKKGILTEKYCNNSSAIRNYPVYSPN